MKLLNLLMITLLIMTINLTAQDADTVRYFHDIFPNVNVQEDVEYAQNISILTGQPDTVSLVMDIYTPAGDEATDRPLILFFHTGTFLPQYFNGQITGNKKDSAAVEICKRFARKGYVAASVDYRFGWNPVAQEQDIRTGTLLQAAYRGVLDAKACNRFFRMTVAEMDNPFGIDPDKIVAWGQGTGGYIALGVYLDDYAELEVDKFIDSRTLTNYIDTNLLGNVFGNTPKPLNLVNHPEYPSDFAFVINMGGAMGDIGWIDGDPNKEPPVVCFHPLTDPFAPIYSGAVINPLTGQFVIQVDGSRRVVEVANATGVNDPIMIDESPEELRMESAELDQRIDALNQIQFTDSAANLTYPFAEENYYPFVFSEVQSGPWEWWNPEQVRAEIEFINQVSGADLNADELLQISGATNPDMSKEKAMAYIDTLEQYTRIRMYCAMIGDCSMATSVDLLSSEQVNLNIFPNPAREIINFEVAQEYSILDFGIYDMIGRQVDGAVGIEQNRFTHNISHLDNGLYIVRLRVEEGIIAKKVLISRP